jgi:hypothetical protein
MVYYNMFDKNLIYGILISILILCIYHIVSCQCNDGFQVGGEKYGGKHRGKHGGKQRRKLEKEIIQLEREISQVSDTCDVGETVKCEEGGVDCAGNQCCPDGSTCPSAENSFLRCPHEKNNDCTEDSPPEECDPDSNDDGGGCAKGKCCRGHPPTCQNCGACIYDRDCFDNKVCDNGNCIDPPPVNCEGHWDVVDNCDKKCERKYVVDTPASNGGEPCDNIGETIECEKYQGKCQFAKCENNLANRFTYCTTCTTDTPAEKYQLPNCVNLLPCKQLSPELCTGFSSYRCYYDTMSDMCLDKKNTKEACKIDDECVSKKCTNEICE